MATEAPRKPAAPPSSALSGAIHTSSPGHSGATVPSPRPAQHRAARQLLEGCLLSTLGSAPRSPQLSTGRLRGHGGPLPGPLGSLSAPPLFPGGAAAHPNSCSAGSQRGMGPQRPGPSWVTHTHSRTAGALQRASLLILARPAGPLRPPGPGDTPHAVESQAGSPWAVPCVTGAPSQAQAREGRRRVPWTEGTVLGILPHAPSCLRPVPAPVALEPAQGSDQGCLRLRTQSRPRSRSQQQPRPAASLGEAHRQGHTLSVFPAPGPWGPAEPSCWCADTAGRHIQQPLAFRRDLQACKGPEA